MTVDRYRHIQRLGMPVWGGFQAPALGVVEVTPAGEVFVDGAARGGGGSDVDTICRGVRCIFEQALALPPVVVGLPIAS